MIEEVNLSEFPTTRYQGSKRKILPWIHHVLKEIEFDTVLDGCGGSGSVSYLFKKMGKAVTYNDNLKFNHIIGKALIQNQRIKFLDEDIDNLLAFDLNAPDLIGRIFNDIYFPDAENTWLDNMGFGILNMNHYTGATLEYKKSLAYYALFQACLTKRPFNLFHRNNLHIRTADVKRNFGNKHTWEKDFADTFKAFLKEANNRVFDSRRPCLSINQSVFDIEDVDYDLVYLDPPYIKGEGSNETSNYLKCYHFLEGLVNYDHWQSRIDFTSSNLSFSEAQTDSHFNKTDIYTSFELLIEKYSGSTIVISYKNGGIPSIDYIVKVMKRYKDRVYTRSQKYIYALNKQNSDASKNREVLIIGI